MSADGVAWNDLKPVAKPTASAAPPIQNPRATAAPVSAAGTPTPAAGPAKWDDLTPITRPAVAPAAAETGDFMRGLKTSAHQLPQLVGGSVAFLGDAASRAGKALGGDGAVGNKVVDYGLGVYKKHGDDTQQLSKDSDSFTHMIQNPRELGSWLKYNAGYMGGQMLESAAVMGAGALAGSEVPVAGNAAGAVAGLVAKPMVKRMVFKKVGELMAEKGLSREAAEVAARQAVNKRLGAEAGAATAGLALNESQELGSIYGDAREQATQDGRELSGSDLARIGVSSVAAAGVDTLGDRLLLGDALKGVKVGDVAAAGKSALRQRLEATGAAMGKDALKGGATEAAQTVIERYGAGQSLTDGEAFTDVLDSTMAGAVGGGMAGVGAGLHTQKPASGPLGRVADAAGEHAAAAQAAQDAAQAADAGAVAADTPVVAPDALVARAQRRMDLLNAKVNGTEPVAQVDSEGNTFMVPGQPPQELTDAEKNEHAFLSQNGTDPQALADRLGVQLAPVDAATDGVAANDAAPVAPVVNEAAPAPAAAGTPAPSVAQGDPLIAPGTSTPVVPWVNTTTGESRAPSADELTSALADRLAWQYNNQGHMRVPTKALSAEWGVPEAEINKARKAASPLAVSRVKSDQSTLAQSAPAQERAAPVAAPVATTRATQVAAVQSEKPAAATPAPASAPANTAPQVATAAHDDLFAGDNAKLAGIGAGSATATADTANQAVAAPQNQPQPQTATPAAKEPSHAQEPHRVPSQPEAAGNRLDRAVGRDSGEGQGGTAGEATPRVPSPAPQEKAAAPRAGMPAAEAAEPAPAVAATKTPHTGSVSASGVAPGHKVSAAARDAEGMRIKTADGETNGRSHVDSLINDGFTKVASTRAGDKLVHSLVNAAGEHAPIKARQLKYAQEAAARAAPSAVKESLTTGQQRTSALVGAGVGDTIRTTGMGAEIQPGSTWKIERIDKDGTLHTSSPGGGTASWKRGDLEREVRKGATFEKLEPPSNPIDLAAHEAATSPHNDTPEPTQPQIEAGNYKKGHVSVQGLDISIENPKGSTRSGVGPEGPWSHEMSDHYGYLRGTIGADKDHVDVYLGGSPESAKVFVVDQIDQKTGRFDEHKVMLGFDSQKAAIAAYKANFDAGWKVGPVTALSMDDFKAWLKDGDTSKPMADHAPVEEAPGHEPIPLDTLKADKDFRKLLRESGDPHIESPVAAEFAEGYADKKAGRPIDHRKLPTPEAAAGYGPGRFNPVNAYLSGYKAAATGEPASIRGHEARDVAKDLEATKPVPPPAEKKASPAKSVEKAPAVAAEPTVPKRGGIATNGAKVRVVGGKLQYVPRAKETLEAYFKPGDVVPSYGGQDRVISTDFSDTGNPLIRVIAVDKDGTAKPNERERVHATMPSERELLAKLGKPVLAGKAAAVSKVAEPVARLDHGVLNVPLAKRGPDIDAQIDKYKREQAAAAKNEGAGRRSEHKAKMGEVKRLIAAVPHERMAALGKPHDLTVKQTRKMFEEAAWRHADTVIAALRKEVDKAPAEPAAAVKRESRASQFSHPEPAEVQFRAGSAPTGATAASVAQLRTVNDIAREVTATWGPNQPQVRVVHSAELLPAKAKEDPRYRRGHGYYDGSTVYLVAPNLRTRADVLKVLAHEAVGHYGMDRVVDDALGAGAWNKIEDKLDALRKDPSKTNQRMRDLLNEVERRYRTENGTPADRMTFAREFMAISAEKGIRSSMFDQVIAALRAFVRKVIPGLSVSEHELRQLLVRSDKYLRSQQDGATSAAIGDPQPGYSFAGENARTADRSALGLAQQMEAMGRDAVPDRFGNVMGSPEETHIATGWHRGADGKWRWEIDDSKATISPEKTWDAAAYAGKARLDDVLNHPALFEAYPQLADIKVALANLPRRTYGHFDPKTNTITLNSMQLGESVDGASPIKSTLLHEVQHVIQTAEGFARGGNIEDAKTLPEYQQLLANYSARGLTDPEKLAAHKVYQRLAGETEARNTQQRLDMSAADRRATPPSETADVYRGDQIVRFNEVPAQSRDGWDQGFPDAVTAHPHGVVSKHPDYAAAKGGDAAAALRLARDLVTPEFVEKVRAALPEGSKPVIVPVVAREAAGDNEIPRMAARVLASRLGLEADTNITQADKVSRGGSGAMHRLANQPAFEGKVDAGQAYVLLDDTLAQGGTLAQLKTHIEREGGQVVLATALTAKDYSRKLALDPESLRKVRGRFGAIEGWWKQQFGHGFDGLTESEARAILTFERGRLSADGLRNRVAAGKIPEVGRVGEAAAGDRSGAEAPGASGRLSDTPKPRSDFSFNEDADPDHPKPKRNFADASASIEAIEATLPNLDRNAFQQVKDWIAGKARDLEPLALGGLQLRHVLELAADDPTLKGPAQQFANIYQRMDGDRNTLTNDGVTKVDALVKWARQPGLAGWLGKVRPEAKKLFDFMNAVTQLAVDPTNQYERLLMRDAGNEYKPWTKELIKERTKVLRETALTRSGDDKQRIYDEIKDLQRLPAREKVREQKYPELVQAWNALTPAAKEHFQVMRDHYREQSAELEEATLAHIQSLDIPEQNKRAAAALVNRNFADAKVDGVYFPLSRFGDYWISATTKDGEYVFAKYESANAMQQAEKRLLAGGASIEARGRQDNNYKAKDAPSGTFIGDLMGVLKGAPDKVKDEIYQMYLKSLPSLSLRKHGIHRKNIAGYTDDVPRAFASSVFHGAHQLSKARYGWQLTNTLDQMRERMEARRTAVSATEAAHADALIGEIVRRHDWILNPTNNALSNKITGVAFTYFLGASPASAIVNLIQVPHIVMPVLGAQHGWGKASAALATAMKQAIGTGGHMDRVLKGEELDAYRALQKQGTFQRSATHALAGISEGDQLRASAGYTKVMNAVSWMFHTSEVINREATGMAAYRLARVQGQEFDAALKYADEMTNGTHGDYSNANRARYMQGNVQKVVLQFKNYSLAMSWLWGRNFYKAFKGEDAATRALARRTLTGMLGMTGLFAGVIGMPIFNLLRYGAQALHAVGGDDDEPWDFVTEFRSWLAEHLGETAANVIADGAVSQLGANVASRVSMSDLWFRDVDKQMEGEDAYNQMLQSIAGPLGGMVKNVYVGSKQFSDGHAWRGIETMLPNFAKNAMKATRFAHEGVNNLRGDPIVPDVGAAGLLVQAMGFQPTQVAEQQRINSALMNYQKFIQDRRQGLMNAFAMAQQAGDTDGRAEVVTRIRSFNAKYPEIAIRMSNLQASLRTRAQRSAQSDNGIMLSKKLGARVRQEVGAMAGE